MVHDARIVRMNAQHLPPTIRKWMGDSIGRWDGDTLVIDTTNFTDKTRFRGSSEALHIVERLTRVDAKTLRYQFTIEDPTTWTKPWTGGIHLAGDQRPHVRIRLPRRQLRDGQHPARRAPQGSGRGEENEAAVIKGGSVLLLLSMFFAYLLAPAIDIVSRTVRIGPAAAGRCRAARRSR